MLTLDSERDLKKRNAERKVPLPVEEISDQVHVCETEGKALYQALLDKRVFISGHAVERFGERFGLPEATGKQILYFLRYSKHDFSVTVMRRPSNHRYKTVRLGLRSKKLNMFFVAERDCQEDNFDFVIKTVLSVQQNRRAPLFLTEEFQKEIIPFFTSLKYLPSFDVMDNRIVFYLTGTNGRVYGKESRALSLNPFKLKQDLLETGFIKFYDSVEYSLYNPFFRDSDLEVHADNLYYDQDKWFKESGLESYLNSVTEKEVKKPVKPVKPAKLEAPVVIKPERFNVNGIDYPLKRIAKLFRDPIKNKISGYNGEGVEGKIIAESYFLGPYYLETVYWAEKKELRIDVLNKDKSEILRTYLVTGYCVPQDIKDLALALSYGELEYADKAGYKGVNALGQATQIDGPVCSLPRRLLKTVNAWLDTRSEDMYNLDNSNS